MSQISEVIHPWIDGCHNTFIERFTKVFKMMMPVYGTLHFVPMLLLRTQHLRREQVSNQYNVTFSVDCYLPVYLVTQTC